jgi:hypothetical protein
MSTDISELESAPGGSVEELLGQQSIAQRRSRRSIGVSERAQAAIKNELRGRYEHR